MPWALNSDKRQQWLKKLGRSYEMSNGMTVIQPKKKSNLSNELKYRTTRVRIFVWLGKDPTPIPAYAFVNEIKKKGVAVFISRKLPLNDVALIAFENEKAQPFRAKIIGNQSKADERHMQSTGYNWKCGFQFEFASEEEAKRYMELWSDIRKKVSMLAREIKQKNYNVVNGNPDELNLDDALADMELGGGTDKDKKGAA